MVYGVKLSSSHYAAIYEYGIVAVIIVGVIYQIIYNYVKLDPFDHIRRLTNDSTKSLTEDIVVATMADYIYLEMHQPGNSIYWHVYPDVLHGFMRHCVANKLTLLSLRQVKHHLRQYCITNNFRDCIDLSDQLIQHTVHVVQHHGLDSLIQINTVKVLTKIINLVRLVR